MGQELGERPLREVPGVTPRRCPHEVREVREGCWVATVDYRFRCTCPDRAKWDCDQYSCLCPERRAVPVD